MLLFYFCRGASLGGTVDVVCYRDYTREGKRINTHSLIIQGVQLPAEAEGQPTVLEFIAILISYRLYKYKDGPNTPIKLL
jgi:hypothetical protein